MQFEVEFKWMGPAPRAKGGPVLFLFALWPPRLCWLTGFRVKSCEKDTVLSRLQLGKSPSLLLSDPTEASPGSPLELRARPGTNALRNFELTCQCSDPAAVLVAEFEDMKRR